MTINNNDFKLAINIIDNLTSNEVTYISEKFSSEFSSQNIAVTCIKILNQCRFSGTSEQKKALLAKKNKVVVLNNLLKKGEFQDLIQKKLGVDASDTKGMYIHLPQTKPEKMIEAATKILRIFFTIIIDIALLPGALVILLISCCKSEFNPKEKDIKKEIPILLLHGSGFNQVEWVLGRQFLKKKSYGSVFSLNFDGLVSNDPKKGIEDYAKNKVRPEIERIKKLTGSDQVILIGHSMGGLVAGYYAENFAASDATHVNHIISIASPWQGTPMIDNFWKLGGSFAKEKETKRHQQMSIDGGTSAEPKFRQNLVSSALHSERSGIRKYYNIWSSTDYAVPRNYGSLTEDTRRQRKFSFLGHYALVAWPSVWFQVRSWLDEIYRR